MKRLYLLVLGFLLLLNTPGIAQQGPRVTISFDQDWKFFKGDINGAEKPDFADAQWRSLNVPHDWSIEGPYDRNNNTGRGGGYLPGGLGWYRKSFTLDPADAERQVFIEFDGVMANSDVWINGYHLGKRPNGYASFEYELTGHLNAASGKKNVIAVRADNSIQPASRWYTGAGIYRHVRLVIANPVHIAHWGDFISASEVSGNNATLHVQTEIINQSGIAEDVVVRVDISGTDGKTVATSEINRKIAGGKDEIILQQIAVVKPVLWDIVNPKLYKARTTIWAGKKMIDETVTSFGIREAIFEAATGFWLNGKNIKIKGVCLHHDGGAFGAAVPLGVWKRRLALLKETGVNAIRTSHNPPSPEFLDLCDQMGFLVMDETFDTWNARKSNAENGYNLYFTDWWQADTRDMALRDRNHPSLIIYSIGNEIHDNLNDSSGFEKYKMQQDLVHSFDTTRPVTMALFRPALSHVYENGFADMMDVVGQNYRENELVAAHENNPKRRVIGTENRMEQAAWIALRDKAYMAGQFLWCGFDYLGESDWPSVVNGQGLFDRTGSPRAIAYQRKSWWSDQPVIYIMRRQGNAGAGDWISDWSPTDIDTYDEAQVQAFSNCDEVELFLNGKSVGVRMRPDDNASPRTWSFPFQKGTLKAVAKNKGQVVAEQELKTAGIPARILLTADKRTIENSWDDVTYIIASVTDENGIPTLNADNKITFNITGPGIIAAVDNGDLTSVEPAQATTRWAYRGKCIAVIKGKAGNGNVMVTASADGLKPGTVSLDVSTNNTIKSQN